VTTIVASDQDAATTLTYSVSGVDAARFTINASTGALTFTAQPNVETPGDVGADNFYNVVVTASDGALSDTQALTIEVRRIINGTAGNDTLILNGTAGPDDLFGFAGNDVMTGLAGSDILDGGTGNDSMTGGLGDDTYVVDSSLDTVVEAAAGGTDTVLASSASFTLGTAVENLTFTGAGNASGLGNDLDNVLTGNAGKDDLRGLGGNDSIVGLGGIDRLSGDAGNDRLDGGIGADVMIGGAGNDVFIVDERGDKAVERDGEGTDTVEASATFTVRVGIENLTLTGMAAINGTGNLADNNITGNAQNNILNGGGGNDTLAAGLGLDTLIGGRGADKFVFDSLPNTLSNVDVVQDFVALQGDKVQLSKADFAALGSLGALAQGAFLSSATAVSGQDLDDRVIYNSATGRLYYDADGLGGEAAVQIATFGTRARPALAFTDFEIIA
jgi:Ca2+-binding RTX toxin-like protein